MLIDVDRDLRAIGDDTNGVELLGADAKAGYRAGSQSVSTAIARIDVECIGTIRAQEEHIVLASPQFVAEDDASHRTNSALFDHHLDFVSKIREAGEVGRAVEDIALTSSDLIGTILEDTSAVAVGGNTPAIRGDLALVAQGIVEHQVCAERILHRGSSCDCQRR